MDQNGTRPISYHSWLIIDVVNVLEILFTENVRTDYVWVAETLVLNGKFAISIHDLLLIMVNFPFFIILRLLVYVVFLRAPLSTVIAALLPIWAICIHFTHNNKNRRLIN